MLQSELVAGPLEQVALTIACGRIQVSSMPVDGIADKVGYASRSQFSRAFNEQFGMSPADFRKQYN
jgi:AraC-like DNA-binding protein